MNNEFKGLTFEQCQRMGLEPAHFYFETNAQSENKTRRAAEIRNKQEAIASEDA